MTSIAKESFSLRELALMAGNSTPAHISIERLIAHAYQDQQLLIERAVDWCGTQMVASRHLKQDHSEDQLTIEIAQMLGAMGYDATRETQVGGHCDIVVRGVRDFLWVGESKLHRDYDWLLMGYEQLESRYLTGLPGQDTGELIIFSRNERIDDIVEKWIKHLSVKRPDVKISASAYDCLVHYSTHPHPGSGREIRVRHKPIHLHWKPKGRR